MPGFPISELARKYTRKFIDSALNRIEDVSTTRDALKINDSLNAIVADYPITWLGDVVNHVWKFGLLRATSIEMQHEMPFVEVGGADVPILQDAIFGFPLFPSAPFSPAPLELIEAWLRPAHLKMVRVDPKSAVSIFEKLLSPFLENRFESGIRAGQGGGEIPPTPGSPPQMLPNGNYLVSLISRQRGWQALKSPAYAIDFTYFGAPTFPVWGYTSGGRWIFAGRPPTGIGWVTDTTVFVIPETVTPAVTAF